MTAGQTHPPTPGQLQCTDDLTNVHVENFAPNLTAHIQPNDAGIICCFKAHYHSKFVSQAIDQYDNDVLPALIYEIDQLKAMHLADVAWHEVDTTTIWNCWCKAGIIPDALYKPVATPTPSVPISFPLNSEPLEGVDCAEKDISDSLNQLEELGVLQQRNWVDLEELLNPLSEQELVGEISDEEIF